MRCLLTVIVAAVAVLAPVTSLFAYPVGPAYSLEKMQEESDIVCKATVVDTRPIDDESFKKVWGFEVQATRLKVVSPIKGKPEDIIEFRHYGESPNPMGHIYMPQYYKFEPRRTYILFAKKTGAAGVYQQSWKSHTGKEDQGVILACDAKPLEEKPLADIIWHELTSLIETGSEDDAAYAVNQLREMSDSDEFGAHHFKRERVMTLVGDLASHKNPAIAKLAILTLGGNNPFTSPDYVVGWLATIGKGHLPGYSTWNPAENTAGKTHWRTLADAIESKAPAEIRAAAVRALGRSPQLRYVKQVISWTKDEDPLVQQAAITLLADYPKSYDRDAVLAWQADDSPLVRIGVCHLIGYAQDAEQIETLAELIHDTDRKVSAAAAICLLSFAAEHSHPILKKNMAHPDFSSVFVNALANEDPGAYRKELAKIIRHDLMPDNWWGGHVPWGISWNLLFAYLQKMPRAALVRGDFDAELDALESPEYYSSSEPRDLYAFYLQRSMRKRAKAFREDVKTRVSYDIDYYFDMVDKNPQQYERNR